MLPDAGNGEVVEFRLLGDAKQNSPPWVEVKPRTEVEATKLQDAVGARTPEVNALRSHLPGEHRRTATEEASHDSP